MRYACTAFYSHPWAWNEIGFGGPAYPRGYKNIGLDRREPWEGPEVGAHDPKPRSLLRARIDALAALGASADPGHRLLRSGFTARRPAGATRL